MAIAKDCARYLGRSKPLFLLGSILALAAHTALFCQELALEDLPAVLRQRAVIVDITSRVIEQDHLEVWNSANSKVTIPGRPVGIKLVGANIIVALQFTPYRRGDGRPMLVAQGQIWIDIPNQGMSYQTTMETIAMDYGEPVFFFPLGSREDSNKGHIEIQVILHPYLESSPEQTTSTGFPDLANPEKPDYPGEAEEDAH